MSQDNSNSQNKDQKQINSDEILKESKTTNETEKQKPIASEKKETEKSEKDKDKKEEKKVEMVKIEKSRLEELETAEKRAIEEIKLERANAINYRKRLEKQREEFVEIASARVLTKLLYVKDDLTNLINHGKDTIPKEHLEGINLALQRVEDIFKQEDVSLIKIVEGKTAYDPRKHEAILTQPVPNMEPNIVLTLVNAGFIKGERVLRPAKVIISAKLPDTKKAEEVKQEKDLETKEQKSESEIEKTTENKSNEPQTEMNDKKE